MPYTTANRVQETTSTSGTGTLTLNGAVAGFKNFNNGIGIGNTTSYVIFDPTANVWEAGIGTLLTANTFGRTQVLSNSSNTTALINFAGNTSNVWCDYLAEKSVTQFDVGTDANQIPLNQYLGTMAWQDAKSVNIQGGTAVLTGGTATLTSLTVNGSTVPTNGVYLPATNALGFSTNSVERMRIDANGNLSIGNSSPTAKLDVSGAVLARGANATVTSGASIMDTASGVARFISYGNTATNGSWQWLSAPSAGSATQYMGLSATGHLTVNTGTTNTAGYTVATLPTGVTGMRAYVTNALAPSYGATVVGGGAVTIPVFYNGTNWICA